MTRILILIIALVVSSDLHAQVPTEQIQREIIRTVWGPFKTAFESLDGAALNALYADQVLRVTPDGIDTKSAFKEFNATRFDANRRNGDRIHLDFWLDDRSTDTTTSYEVGFYRITITPVTGATSTHYGQFHIVLKKLAGHWKIVQDWDTGTIGGLPISESDFSRKSPIQF